MKKILLAIFMMPCFTAFGQISNDQMQKTAQEFKMRYGIKAGYNFAKVTGSTPGFNPGNNNGFMVAGFIAPPARGLGFRSEIVFSKQGFSFDASGKMTAVSQSYLYMPQLTTFTIAQRVQLQAGAQMGYLLSSKQSSSGSSAENVMNYFNRIDYGAAAGVEIYPVRQLILGARYNISFGNIYKQQNTSAGMSYPFPIDPSQFRGKNGVVQIFVGIKL